MIKKLLFPLLILLVIGIWIWWSVSLSPVNSTTKQTQIFVVAKGEGVKAIAKSLEKSKLIKNQWAFYLMVKQMGIESKIQAGSFRLSPAQSSQQIATALTKGSLDVWITIPEGKRAEEIGDILQKNMPSFKQEWRQNLDANEGYLFPDTYLFPQDATITQIITIMRNNFDKKYAQATAPKTVSLTQEQIVTIASIIEREAITPDDMKLVASVLENRLDAGIPLGSDVTVEYALGYNTEEKTWWKKDLTIDDLAINSPYNTRVVAGLPPTPISNPGIVALNAAANPSTSDYMFFIADKDGKVHFAKTLEEHNANIKKYGLL